MKRGPIAKVVDLFAIRAPAREGGWGVWRRMTVTAFWIGWAALAIALIALAVAVRR